MTQKTALNFDAKYLNSLSRIFTPIVLNSVAEKGYSAYLTEVCNNCKILQNIDSKMPFSDFLNWVYGLLFKNYRNEYVYKNVIANKILLGKHSLHTSQMLTEFRVEKCKADVVIINGTSTVYEIKSEYDTFSRLEDQLSAYMKVFDHINVITTEPQAVKLSGELPVNVGILVVTNRNTISIYRESLSNKMKIETSVLFDSLRKHEYLQIVNNYYGSVPNVPNTRIFKECKNLFTKMNPVSAHDLTMDVLKKRNDVHALEKYLKNAPASLSAYIMSNSNDRKKISALSQRLNTDIGSILAPA